jgi:hypothetical protein
MDAIDDVFRARIGDVSGGGKLASDMREIWVMQPRFEKRVGSTPFGLVEQARFRAAFDFMRLRADIGEVEEVLADWWQEFSMASDSLRQDLVDQVREEQQKRKRRLPFTWDWVPIWGMRVPRWTQQCNSSQHWQERKSSRSPRGTARRLWSPVVPISSTPLWSCAPS